MTSELDETELEALIKAILVKGGARNLDKLLINCHRLFVEHDSLQPHERYFRLELSYRGFFIHVPEVVIEGDDIMAARVQFKRTSPRLQPLFNCNRKLVKRVRQIVSVCYALERGIESAYRFDGEREGTRVHFGNDRAKQFWWKPDSSFEQWSSETAIFDEPYSSGQTPPDQTTTRNDFVILRFERRMDLQTGLSRIAPV
jgi:hypothetical protein